MCTAVLCSLNMSYCSAMIFFFFFLQFKNYKTYLQEMIMFIDSRISPTAVCTKTIQSYCANLEKQLKSMHFGAVGPFEVLATTCSIFHNSIYFTVPVHREYH